MEEAIRLPGLETRVLGRHFLHLKEVDSTNSYLKEHGSILPHGATVIADRQTAGKGRLGRSWSDGAGGCLPLSILFKDLPRDKLPLLPLVTGLAVKRGAESLSGRDCAIKWSNDVLLGDRKICGILCESRLNSGNSFAVAGMGLNLNQTEEEFQAANLEYAASLFLVTGKKTEKYRAAAVLLNEIEPLYEKFLQNGFSALLEEYKACCVNLGRWVRISVHGEVREGEAVDILPNGSLLCRIGTELVELNAGETSVRGLYGYV